MALRADPCSSLRSQRLPDEGCGRSSSSQLPTIGNILFFHVAVELNICHGETRSFFLLGDSQRSGNKGEGYQLLEARPIYRGPIFSASPLPLFSLFEQKNSNVAAQSNVFSLHHCSSSDDKERMDGRKESEEEFLDLFDIFSSRS